LSLFVNILHVNKTNIFYSITLLEKYDKKKFNSLNNYNYNITVNEIYEAIKSNTGPSNTSFYIHVSHDNELYNNLDLSVSFYRTESLRS
jgi:hypothetical protein